MKGSDMNDWKLFSVDQPSVASPIRGIEKPWLKGSGQPWLWWAVQDLNL